MTDQQTIRVQLSGTQPVDYTLLAEDQTPATGDTVAVPLARLLAEPALLDMDTNIGVILPSDTAYSDLEGIAGKIAFALIDFPGFADGRGFSLAVRLRKDYGFTGSIEATGHVIPDQAQFLLRAGFDVAETSQSRHEAFEVAVKRFQHFYQADFTGRSSVAHIRHGASDPTRKAS